MANDRMTDEEFQSILKEIVRGMSVVDLLAVDRINMILRELFYEDVIKVWENRQNEQASRPPENIRETF